jgi:hypothetical protein
MPRLPLALCLLMMAAAPAAAQRWPLESGPLRDGDRGAIDRYDRYRQYPEAPEIGQDRREAITGVLDQVVDWVRRRGEMVGDRDRQEQQYYDLRRSWDAEWRRYH